ncbi:MAG: ImmA/IrrE family metallo-endopeptidase, partial [Nanoarchaeota archaeon]|nr:ImmA/IrrE family metallo-endopeptidase [Nanoarchaeota archaeon]
MNSHHYLKQVEEKLQELAAETDAVKKSAEFQQYLDTMAKFWQYSYHNQLLIHFALPSATKVAGFKTWSSLGRRIKKGSKAIRILAPVTIKDDREEEVIVNFSPVTVFDLSQTEGQELPEMEIALKGDDQQKLLDSLMTFCEVKGIKLNFKELGVNGLYGYSQGGQIVVSSLDDVNMQVNTLVHEIAHELLHHDGEGKTLSKKQKEIQA